MNSSAKSANRLYRGEIVHREQSYPGVHEALVGDDLWEAVQRQLDANRHDRKTGSAAGQPSRLAGRHCQTKLA